MDLAYAFFIMVYMSFPCILMFMHGALWFKIGNKYNNQYVTTGVFATHYIIMIFLIQIPFLITMLSNVCLLCSLFLGNKFQVIGLTGGIATGKSTVSEMFAKAGFSVIDADKISKEISELPSTLQEIREKFGDDVFDQEGKLDRIKLGDLIFKNSGLRKTLNSIMFSKVRWRMFTDFLKLKFVEKKGWVILDVPLLYESGFFQYFCFPIIVVNVSDENTIK